MKSMNVNTNKYPAQFMFATGDCSRWMIMSNDAVRGGWYNGKDREIVASHTSDTPYTAKMYRRSGVEEDPWITFTDHNHCSSLYQANNWDPSCSSGDLGDLYQGLNVFVRSSASVNVTTFTQSTGTSTSTNT